MKTNFQNALESRSSSLSSRGMQVVWRDWCVLRYFSATDVRIERSERRSTGGHDHAEGHNRHPGTPGELRFGDRARSNGGHDPATAGKLAAPCGPQARAQRGPGPPLLPGKVRSHGSDRWDTTISVFFFCAFPLFFHREVPQIAILQLDRLEPLTDSLWSPIFEGYARSYREKNAEIIQKEHEQVHGREEIVERRFSRTMHSWILIKWQELDAPYIPI